MKISSLFLVTGLALALTACGGGGSDPLAADQGTSNATAANTPNTTELMGSWNRIETAPCSPNFKYGPYWYRSEGLTFGTNTLEGAIDVYNDAACSSKAGRLIEKYTLVFSPGAVPGRSNSLRILATFTGASTAADGGTGLTLNKVPDGTQSGANPVTKTFKSLLDVENAQLFVANLDSPPDSEGYPTELHTPALYQR